MPSYEEYYQKSGFNVQQMKGMYLNHYVKLFEQYASSEQSAKFKQKYPHFETLKDYPVSTFFYLLIDASKTLYPTATPEEAGIKVGKLVINSLFKTPVGKIMKGMLLNSSERISAAVYLIIKAQKIPEIIATPFVEKIGNKGIRIFFSKTTIPDHFAQADALFHGMIEEISVESQIPYSYDKKYLSTGVEIIYSWN